MTTASKVGVTASKNCAMASNFVMTDNKGLATASKSRMTASNMLMPYQIRQKSIVFSTWELERTKI
ncbi:hypothetical protein [Lederbergia lenta]|uniref:Uncharacterized protein n=1 Tax=Lederbergia lenta TaxID=1467 RepID=A0A2X4WHE2_LEDLE|nr:hypothetical protein [Lederbergia lenta]MCM3112925.1 hypothetical protein [Lederbergia lenta]MEC2326108.1 hypothetical protein [Lederbergia lenta]SQI63476.1 Uncharacterised protein [Lederbergia lenta]